MEKEVEDTEETEESEESEDIINIEYGFAHDELLAMGAYGSSQAIDYEILWYGETKPSKFEPEEDIYTTVQEDTTKTDLFTEAKQAFEHVQYKAATNSMSTVDFQTKRDMDNWIKFNMAFFKLYESNHALTREVNYGV